MLVSGGLQASTIVEDIHALKDSRIGMTTLEDIDSVRYEERHNACKD